MKGNGIMEEKEEESEKQRETGEKENRIGGLLEDKDEKE